MIIVTVFAVSIMYQTQHIQDIKVQQLLMYILETKTTQVLVVQKQSATVNIAKVHVE